MSSEKSRYKDISTREWPPEEEEGEEEEEDEEPPRQIAPQKMSQRRLTQEQVKEAAQSVIRNKQPDGAIPSAKANQAYEPYRQKLMSGGGGGGPTMTSSMSRARRKTWRKMKRRMKAKTSGCSRPKGEGSPEDMCLKGHTPSSLSRRNVPPS